MHIQFSKNWQTWFQLVYTLHPFLHGIDSIDKAEALNGHLQRRVDEMEAPSLNPEIHHGWSLV